MSRTLTAFLMAAVLLAGGAAQAAVFLPATLNDLVLEARAIAHGRIVDVQAQWVDGDRRIESLVTLEVETYLKGNLGRSVTFRVPGGQIGIYRSVTMGAPVFTQGDEVVLFLGAEGPAMPYVLGLSQGVFRVTSDAPSGRRLVTPPALIGHAGRPQPIVRGDAGRRPRPLETFGAQVAALVTARPEGAGPAGVRREGVRPEVR